MAAIVDRRFDGATTMTGNQMASSPNRVVSDEYGGWMTRKSRGILFGLFGLSLVLGTFLPGIIFVSRYWNQGIRDPSACGPDVTLRALVTCCVFIGHALLVIPMFIRGDRLHSDVANQGNVYLGNFWRTRLAHTATVLQACGNIVELALLAWTAAAFWDTRTYGGACYSNYNFDQFRQYMWAMLIIGFITVAASLVTLKWQYTSAAIRDNYDRFNGKTMATTTSAL